MCSKWVGAGRFDHPDRAAGDGHSPALNLLSSIGGTLSFTPEYRRAD
jgi:hypothetical protein